MTITPIEVLHLEPQTENILIKRGIDNIGKLSKMDWAELLKIKSLGPTRVKDISTALSKYVINNS